MKKEKLRIEFFKKKRVLQAVRKEGKRRRREDELDCQTRRKNRNVPSFHLRSAPICNL